VIGFEDEAIGLAEMDSHMIRQVAEIGADGDFRAVSAEGESDRVGCIVRNGERVHVDIADGEVWPAWMDSTPLRRLRRCREGCAGSVPWWLGDVERRFPEARTCGRPLQ